VAVLGRGIAVVEQADETEVEALLGNKTILRMRRNDIAWNRQNMRWEAEVSARWQRGTIAASSNGKV